MGEHKIPRTPQAEALKDAHARLAQVPHYTGAIVVLFTKDGQNVQLGSTLPQEIAPRVLRAFLAQLDPPPSIILPSH